LANEDILGESEEEEVDFETQSKLDTEEAEEDPAFASIYCISQNKDPAYAAFAAWQPYIPPEPVFRSSSAQSWWSDSSPLASLSLEPTLTRISSIKCLNSTIGQTSISVRTTQNNIRMKRSPRQGWKPYKPATNCYKPNWNRHWPESSIMWKRARNWRKEFHNHPEQSKPFKPWKPQLPFLDKTNKNPNTKSQNMPPETDVGNAHQPFTRCPSRTYSTMMSGTIITKTGSWETKWRRFSNKIHSWPTKFQKPIRRRQKNSKRTPLWPWSPRRWPHTCLSNTTTEVKETQERKISPRGENHFSKRRSDDSESESKDTKRKSESKNIMTMMTDSKTKDVKGL
jgi:hypothetical protein